LLQHFQKKINFFFVHKKLKKHPQKLLRKTQIHFFPLLPELPELPKQPKQKNSCVSARFPVDYGCFHISAVPVSNISDIEANMEKKN
jgi:hypothetical protein